MEKNSTMGSVGTIKGDGWEDALMDGAQHVYNEINQKKEKISNSNSHS